MSTEEETFRKIEQHIDWSKFFVSQHDIRDLSFAPYEVEPLLWEGDQA